jgi:hypothetical protein
MGLWIWRGNENATFTVGWKKFPKTEWDVAGQVKCESHVDGFVFFTSRVLCIMNSYVRGQTVNRWYYFEVLKRVRENVRRKRPQLWRNHPLIPPSWQSASSCISTGSWLFGQHKHNSVVTLPVGRIWFKWEVGLLRMMSVSLKFVICSNPNYLVDIWGQDSEKWNVCIVEKHCPLMLCV